MGSKERILRLKDETRNKILVSALQIAQSSGWGSLSMRKIANEIEYTAPIIYEYFENKEAILLEVSKIGFVILINQLSDAANQYEKPESKMEAMWIAYWKFAFSHKEFYQLMYGVDIACCDIKKNIPEAQAAEQMFLDVISDIYSDSASEELISIKYHSNWSAIHGLISINLVYPERFNEDKNQQILKELIEGIYFTISQ